MITIVLCGDYCRNNAWRVIGHYTRRTYRMRRARLYQLGA
jgi:hypothetical protein